MNFLLTYLKSHWRGEQSLASSFLVNGILVYLAIVAALVGLGTVIPGESFIWVGLGLFAIVMIWSLGGIVRTAIKTIRGSQGTLAKLIAMSLLVVIAVFVYFLIKDVDRLNMF